MPNSNDYAPAYGMVNINACLMLHGKQISLSVKKLFDNCTIIQRPETNAVVKGCTVHPRTIGVSAKVPFLWRGSR